MNFIPLIVNLNSCFRPHQGINKFNSLPLGGTLCYLNFQVSVPIRGSINLTVLFLDREILYVLKLVSVPIRGSINLTNRKDAER